MRIPLIILIVVLLLGFLLDWYIWKALKERLKSHIYSRIHLVVASLLWLMLIVAVCLPRRSGSDEMLLRIMWMLFGYMTVYSAKFVFVIFDLLASLPRLWHKKRLKWLTRCGVGLSVLWFVTVWWGALINRFNHQIVEQTIYIENLPSGFDGFRIVQISDLHVGTYGDDSSYLAEMMSIVNALHPDVVFFTGDIVNRNTGELAPHIDTLKRLHSPNGVYAILGNHDYGDYTDWESSQAKEANLAALVSHIRRDMGWKLLLNQTSYIYSGGDSIAIIGVENVGDPPFKTYGSLAKAYSTPSDSVVKILLTHNPAHWVDSIRNNPEINIPLTLSGHTHAMQMEVGGVSPAALRYETWGGLYTDSINGQGNHQLYVNIGIGTVGLPMRIGATPEITVLTLRPAPACK